MRTRPIQISMDTQLLKQIDAHPETRSHGRSAFLRSAAALYLKARERHDIDRAIAHAYGDKADELLTEMADLMDAQEWPDK